VAGVIEMPKGGLANADPQVILNRYLSNESTAKIGADYGVTRQAIGQFLIKTAEEDWKSAQTARAIAAKEDAMDGLQDAVEELNALKLEKGADKEQREELAARIQLSLARVRAREAALKSAQWDLERVCRRIYGQDRQINVSIDVGDLGERLRRAKERVIDAIPVVDKQQSQRSITDSA